MDQISLYRQDFNLDHKRFPIEINHLLHLLRNIFFVRSCMGVLQTVEIFSQAPSAFSLAKVTGARDFIKGE